MPPNGPNQDQVITVSELNRAAKITIEQRFNQVWVMGEMSNFARPRSGHWYFTLKDEQAQVRCAMFVNRNRSVAMQPGDGQQVLIRGRVSLYEGRGEFQVIVEHMEAAGAGALRQAFDRLKLKLAAEGLFDAAAKKPVPHMPGHVVVITSPTGAALRDVLAVWRRRYPIVQVTLIPSAVQGEAAQSDLLSALQRAETLNPDVILLTRGGGSLEDLWSFNLEAVARAIAACSIPVVSAVGHEIDTTISDLVADLRAPTPSAAAELMVPDAAELLAGFRGYERVLQHHWIRYLNHARLHVRNLALQVPNPTRVLESATQRVDDASIRLNNGLSNLLRLNRLRVAGVSRQLNQVNPARQLLDAETRVAELRSRLDQAGRHRLNRAGERLGAATRMLHSVSPLPTIERGYGLVVDKNRRVISSVSDVSPDDELTTYLSDGSVTSTVSATDHAKLEDITDP